MPEIDDDEGDVEDDDDDGLVIFSLVDVNYDSGNSSEAERYASAVFRLHLFITVGILQTTNLVWADVAQFGWRKS